MRLTEDALRIALRETAQEIDPGSVGDLDLLSDRPERGRAHLLAQRHRRWVTAAAAAAAVLAVAGTAIALAGGPRPSRPASPLAQLPAYYVALQRDPNCQCDVNEPKGYVSDPDRALVVSRVTGKPAAVVDVPRGYGTFAAIGAAADDRTFVVAAQKLTYLGDVYPATRFYLLRIDPAASPGHRAALTPLATPPVPAGITPIGIALSPDGQQLAVISTQTPGVHPVTLRIYDLQAGTHRTWSLPASALTNMNVQGDQPQWAADGRTLGISMLGPHGGREIALLDTTAPRRSFRADARIVQLQGPVAVLPVKGTVVVLGVLTPDGRHVLENTVNFALVRKSGSDAKAAGMRLLNIRTGAVGPILTGFSSAGLIWSNPAGTAVVVWTGVRSLKPAPAWLYAAHQVRRIWLPAWTLSVAW